MPASPELLPLIDARTFPISPNINAAAAATQSPVPIFINFFFTNNPPSNKTPSTRFPFINYYEIVTSTIEILSQVGGYVNAKMQKTTENLRRHSGRTAYDTSSVQAITPDNALSKQSRSLRLPLPL